GVLVHEMVPLAVGVLVGRGDLHEFRLGELVARLEGPIENGAGDQVPHLDAHQRLTASCGRPRHLDVEAVIGRVLVFEEHLALDVDRFYQRCHGTTAFSFRESAVRSPPGTAARHTTRTAAWPLPYRAAAVRSTCSAAGRWSA